LRLSARRSNFCLKLILQETDMLADRLNRRTLIGAAAAALGAAALPARAQETAGDIRNNISSFRMLDWNEYFTDTRSGAILVDTTSRALHYWSEDQSIYRLYPTSVPLSTELTRLGRTEVVQKVVNPSWRPTPSMKERNPEWPDVVEGGAPDNPLGTRALYLSWTYYRIHGTHDTRKIGRKSSNGCIGLYNEHIEELFEMAKVGTQVLLI
jgi:lipoprotein-anchoring transpeptidase ErfK/SrfK